MVDTFSKKLGLLTLDRRSGPSSYIHSWNVFMLLLGAWQCIMPIVLLASICPFLNLFYTRRPKSGHPTGELFLKLGLQPHAERTLANTSLVSQIS